MNIFVSKDGEQHGPFTMEQVRHQLKHGYFSVNDYAWREGMTDWIPLIDLTVSPQIPSLPIPPPFSAVTAAPHHRSFMPMIVALLILLAGAGGGYFAYQNGLFGKTEQTRKKEEYSAHVNFLTGEMNHVLSECEDTVNYAIQFYNAGGTDSMSKYLASTKDADDIFPRVSKQDSSISEKLGGMSNPPVGLEKVYSELDSLHDIYREIVVNVFEPSGSPDDYVTSFKRGMQMYSSQLNELRGTLPEAKRND